MNHHDVPATGILRQAGSQGIMKQCFELLLGAETPNNVFWLPQKMILNSTVLTDGSVFKSFGPEFEISNPPTPRTQRRLKGPPPCFLPYASKSWSTDRRAQRPSLVIYGLGKEKDLPTSFSASWSVQEISINVTGVCLLQYQQLLILSHSVGLPW
jgi:hypothetical protein